MLFKFPPFAFLLNSKTSEHNFLFIVYIKFDFKKLPVVSADYSVVTNGAE
jgi:hypothetical protein